DAGGGRLPPPADPVDQCRPQSLHEGADDPAEGPFPGTDWLALPAPPGAGERLIPPWGPCPDWEAGGTLPDRHPHGGQGSSPLGGERWGLSTPSGERFRRTGHVRRRVGERAPSFRTARCPQRGQATWTWRSWPGSPGPRTSVALSLRAALMN